MKFLLFVYMEWIDLEQDQKQLYEEFIQLCKIVDDGGMYVVWIGEYYGMNFMIVLNLFFNLVDLVCCIKNVCLGIGIVVVLFWYLICLVGEVVMVDLIIDGWLDIGIVCGVYNFEYECLVFGMDVWEVGQWMCELIFVVKQLWKGDYVQNGEFYLFLKIMLVLQLIQENGLFIWVVVCDLNSYEFVIQNGCNVQVILLWNGDYEVEDFMLKFNVVCEKFFDILCLKIMLLCYIYVVEDVNDVKQVVVELNWFFNYFGVWFKNECIIIQGLIELFMD